MISVDLNNLDLTEFTGKTNPGLHCRATFPLFSAHGSENSATVYFELEPGDALGWHTDSVEELLLILKGDVEVSVGDETGALSAGQMALVPTMVRHNLRNIGSETARVLGFFGSANFVATFEEVWLPTNSNMVDTAAMAAQPA
ncbi:MAG: cupin domain-containing protein [Anaerolineaceae bacterium]|nr:cupin domain-containing protein [Anaerolineaceae bacterium]